MTSTILQDIQQKNTKDKYCDRDPAVDHQFYNYFNQTSTMSLFNPQQIIAHQTAALLSAWQFHGIPYPPPLFNGWPLMQPVPFETKPIISPILNHSQEKMNHSNNNNYLIENHNEMKENVMNKKNMSYTSTSTPISSPSHSSDSIESSEHKKDHPKAKVFACKVCDKTFGYKHVLQNHEKIHTGEKMYICTVCNKRFRRDHHLKVHMRLHSGERPYSCTFRNCNRQFVQVANLRRHMKTHDEKEKMCDEKIMRNENCYEISLKKQTNFEYYSRVEQYQTSVEMPEQTEPEDLSMNASRKRNLLGEMETCGRI
ncbi:unnamed protein product [Chironomus riparius]|uniref:C2H2-type domain-containing protein n=1 Tax=Chironomus riparius TaxID=315576 RepID=A0A9N9WQ83_9DIPT|nr:unnamed protein product [Chironomus riparius]